MPIVPPDRWGLISVWAKDPAVRYKLINARAENLSTNSGFRGSLCDRRCLILTDDFYEWEVQGYRSRPWFNRMQNRRAFAIAGL
jgi:putative SOS response-associated peptidase YedK